MLWIACGEAGEPGFTLVALAIAIRVFRVENVRDVGDEDAVLPGRETGGMFQTVEKQGGLVVNAVAIRVFEDLHTPRLQLGNLVLPHAAIFGLFAGGERVVSHFDDPHAAFRVPVDEHRILNKRFSGHQHGLKSWLYVQRFE